MKFNCTMLYVNNVQHSMDFYKRAFGLKERYLHETGNYGEMEAGGAALAFVTREMLTEMGKTPLKADADNPSFEICFESTDVKKAFDKAIDAGAKLSHKIKEEEWGQTTAYVTDPDGYLVCIGSPVEFS